MTPRPSRPRAVTIAAAVLALMLLPGSLVVAHALTPGPAQPGGSLRGNVNGDGFADFAAVVSKRVVAMHNELISSDPKEGAQLDAGPARVTLVFDQPVKSGFSTIIVAGPDGNQWQAGPATEDGTSVSAPVRPLGPAGAYTVAWRIISADGHPARGTLAFTLTIPGTAAAPPPAADRSGSAAPVTQSRSVGRSVWPWAAGAGALLVVGVVLALRTRRTRG